MSRNNVRYLDQYRANRSHGRPRSPASAARDLTAEGVSEAESRQLVEHYLSDVEERIGSSPEGWPLDDTDLEDIRTAAAVGRAHRAVAALPNQRTDAQYALWPAAVRDDADTDQEELW